MDERDEIAQLRADLMRKERELKSVQESFDEYTQSSHELELELEQELSRTEKRNTHLETKNRQYERDIALTRDKLETALAQMRKSEQELSNLRNELATNVAAKRRLEQEQDDLETQVRILEATEADLKHQMEREMEEKVFLLNDQEEQQREHELAIERFRTEIMDLKSELVVLQQKYDTVQAKLAVASTVGSDRSTQSMSEGESEDEYAFRLSVQERDELSREEQIESMQREIKILSRQLVEETEGRERLEAEVIQLQDEAARTDAMEEELTVMTDELIEKAQEIRKRDLEIQSLQEAITGLKMEKAALMEEKDELANTCEQLREESQMKVVEIGQVQEELRDVQAKFDDLLENESALLFRLQKEAELVEQLREEIGILTKSLDESKRARLELEEKIDVHQSEYSKKRREVEELQEINKILTEQLESAERRATELEQASTLSTSSTSSSSSGEDGEFKTADSKRLMLEIQTLRTTITSLTEENTRLRGHDGMPADVMSNKQVSTDLLTDTYTSDQLALKYLAERTRNASLLSRLQTVCGNIQVFCRVRPIIKEEIEKSWGSRLAVNVINQSDVAAMDKRADRIFPQDNSSDSVGDAMENDPSWKVFTFDRILGPEETQNDVFREVEPIAQSVVDGFKACIFAYGQTGSGKTYTMEGTPSNPGLNYRVANHVFQSMLLRGSIYTPDRCVEDESDDSSMERNPEDDINMSHIPSGPCYHVQVGVLEIYNDMLRDLININNPKPLEIRHDSATGDISVPQLTLTTVSSAEQMIDVLKKAQQNRVTGKTNVHMHSSRSHSVVIMQISNHTSSSNQDETDSSDDSDTVHGKLYLVDLAGSERVKKSNVTGTMLTEAAHINKSLSALADVMEALDKKQAHVPYRNSKLTFLLQDVLNSSCKTVMIVNVGPTLETASETYRSLQLASRVRNIVVGRNSITKNKKDILSAKKAYAEIQSLKQQVQASMRKYKHSQQSLVAMKREQKNQSEKQTIALQNRVKMAESQRLNLTNQNEALKRINEELNGQLRSEREAKQKEVEQREAAQRTLRQLNAKTRVSSSHHESVEKLLKDREEEIKKLRQMVTEARQRSTTPLIPRLPSSPPPSKRSRSSTVQNDNQRERVSCPTDPIRTRSSSAQNPIRQALFYTKTRLTSKNNNNANDMKENRTQSNSSASTPAEPMRRWK